MIIVSCAIRRLSLLSFILLYSHSLFAAEGFPGREKYPDVPYIELNELFANFDNYAIVDARSQYEFETLRIKGALNIPIANENFGEQVLKLSTAIDKPFVFYCNGHRCMKSYIATKKALAAGVKKAIAFDAGIFDWTNTYPKHAELLGNSPVDPNHLISSKAFKSRLLDPDKFSEQIANAGGKSIIVDVRDMYQRAGIGFYPGLERWASLDDRQKLNRYIERAKRENKTLYIYDEVGKQVRWLQYALERAGLKNYYFMEKGARAYYDLLSKLEWQ